MSRLTADSEQVQRALTINISVGLRYAIQVIGGIILMLIISPKLTLVILLLLPVLACASIFWGKKLRRLSKKMQEELGEASVAAEEAISSSRTVKLFVGENHERLRFGTFLQAALGTGERRTLVAASF